MRWRMMMTKRTLAAATLAVLPLATGALRADPVPSTDAAATRSVAEHAPGPQWSYFMGEGMAGALLFACPSAGWSCALYTL